VIVDAFASPTRR